MSRRLARSDRTRPRKARVGKVAGVAKQRRRPRPPRLTPRGHHLGPRRRRRGDNPLTIEPANDVFAGQVSVPMMRPAQKPAEIEVRAAALLERWLVIDIAALR